MVVAHHRHACRLRRQGHRLGVAAYSLGRADFAQQPQLLEHRRPEPGIGAQLGRKNAVERQIAIDQLLRIASRLHVTELVPSASGPFLERPILDKRTGEKQVIFLQLEGDLFFAVADELQDRFTAIFNAPVRVVILRLKRTPSVDGTVLSVLDKFVIDMNKRGRHVLLCGVKRELMGVLKAYGLIDRIGRQNVFETGGGVFTSAKQALGRARELVGRSIDEFGIETDEPGEPVYQI